MVKTRLQGVARAEGLVMNDVTMESLSESCSGDIRLILNQMQMMRLSRSSVSFDDVSKQTARQRVSASARQRVSLPFPSPSCA